MLTKRQYQFQILAGLLAAVYIQNCGILKRGTGGKTQNRLVEQIQLGIKIKR